MRLGVAPSGRRSAADAVHLAALAESAGLDEVWVSEDYAERGAFAVAGGIAAVTSTVHVGLGVVNPWTRHVVLTAMEAQALDEIAAGRAIIGLGASNEGWMTGRLGIPFERPITVLAQYTDVLRRLLAGEHVREELLGNLVDCDLDTPARGRIPIVWGVKGPRALALSSEHSDGVFLSVLSSPAYVRWVRETHDPASITAYATFAVDPDPAVARERLRGHTAQFLGMHGTSVITELAGIDQRLAAELRIRLRAGQPGAELVTDSDIAAVTVSGDPEDAAVSLLALRDAGVDSLVFIDDGGSEPEQLVSAIVQVASVAGLR